MSGEGLLSSARPLVEAPLQFRVWNGGAASGVRALVTCPKCAAPAFIRRSERLTETVKQLTAHCTNSGCGHIFEAEIVITRTLVPGLIDRPDLNLPVAPRDTVPHVLPPARDGPDDPDQMSMFSG
jgi:hypothetical protein